MTKLSWQRQVAAFIMAGSLVWYLLTNSELAHMLLMTINVVSLSIIAYNDWKNKKKSNGIR